jgi:hypothetical protein
LEEKDQRRRRRVSRLSTIVEWMCVQMKKNRYINLHNNNGKNNILYTSSPLLKTCSFNQSVCVKSEMSSLMQYLCEPTHKQYCVSPPSRLVIPKSPFMYIKS